MARRLGVILSRSGTNGGAHGAELDTFATLVDTTRGVAGEEKGGDQLSCAESAWPS